ncbi:ATP-binding protein [Lachnospiraceae bacterium ZAX-1]
MLLNRMEGIIVVSIEAICCKLFFETFLENRVFSKKYISIGLFVLLVAAIYLEAFFLTDYFVIKEIFALIAITVIMNVYFRTKLIKGFVLSCLYQGILLSIDYLCMLVIKYIFLEEFLLRFENPIEMTLMVLICKMLLFGIIIGIKIRWGYDHSLKSITEFEWIRFSYFPIMTIVAIVAMMVNFNMLKEQKEMNTLAVIAFGLVIMNIIVFYLMHDIVKREMKIQENKIFRDRVKHQTDMYYSISENFDKQQKRTHEYKNQLGCIEGMLSNGKIEETLNYVQRINGSLQKEIDLIETNNVIVNAIVNSKYKEAIEKNIVMAFKINDLSKLILTDEDVVIILSNLLSNAIEACEKIEGKKVIKLKFIDEENMIILSVKNTVKERCNKVNSTYITTKDDKVNHGIGLINIQDTVKKYNGECVITDNKDEFFFSIIIPY